MKISFSISAFPPSNLFPISAILFPISSIYFPNDHILLRINKKERRAIGLTFLDYSLLAQRTEVGPRSFPLTGLAEISEELREMVLDILQRPPVSDILFFSTYTPSILETIPITSLQPVAITTA